MKRYSKWLVFVLCGALLLGGCGNTKDDDKDDDKPDKTVESEVDETDDEPQDAPDADPTPEPDDVIVQPEATPEPTAEPTSEPVEPAVTEAPAEESLFPAIAIRPHHKEWIADDQTTTLLTVDDFTLYVNTAGYNALQNSFYEQHPGILDEDYADMLSWATEHYTYSNDSFYGYSSSLRAELSRCDNRIVSLRVMYSDYTGGAHGMHATAGETYDAQTGQLLSLADLIADVEGFYPLAVDYINDALYAEYEDGLFSDYQSWVSATVAPENEPYWYLTASGIVIAFSPYEVGPYAMGAPEVTLPYEIFGEFIKEEYLLPQGEFVAKIPAEEDISYIIGASEPVFIEGHTDEWGMENIFIHSGSASVEIGQFSYDTDNYLARHSNGRCFLIVSGDCMSGDYETHIYEISRGAVRECASLFNAYPDSNLITPQNWVMQIRMDILGTYAGSVSYTLSSNGEFTRTGDFYSINTTHALEIIKPLPVIIDNVETTLPAGEKIYVTGTNNIDEIHFQIDGTNQYGTIRFTREQGEWSPRIMINGLPETEYFNNLPYAG